MRTEAVGGTRALCEHLTVAHVRCVHCVGCVFCVLVYPVGVEFGECSSGSADVRAGLSGLYPLQLLALAGLSGLVC